MHYKDLGRYFKRYYRTVLEKKKTNTKKAFLFSVAVFPSNAVRLSLVVSLWYSCRESEVVERSGWWPRL